MKYIITLCGLLYMSLVVNAQGQDSIKLTDCIDVKAMKVSKNIYSPPYKLNELKYDTVKFYVLPNKNLSSKKYKYRSNPSLVDDFQSDRKSYQKAILANYSQDTIFITSYFIRGLFLIQEAKDENNKWHPIEAYNIAMSCPVGEVDNFTINPHEFINIYLPRYCGTFKTEFRLKLATDNNIIYSDSFIGSINLSQFKKIKENPNRYVYPTFFEK